MSKEFVIGIVSYFPDKIREQRQKYFINLLNKCSTIFSGIDIVIIAQNWKDFEPYSDTNRLIIYKYGKLGISGARRKLREIFLNSGYDFLIMFDDDNILDGTKEDGDKYLDLMRNNPNGFGLFDWKRGQLWGFCIAKSLFKIADYPKEDTEKGEVFEDNYLSQICLYLHPNFTDLRESGVKVTENYKVKSTWWNSTYNLKEIEVLTDNLIEQFKRGY